MGNKNKNIIILGAGFAGLRVALDLAHEFDRIPGHEIVLIDKTDTHLYTPDLYEIATAYYPTITSTCLTQLKETVATKISSLISGKPITFLQDEVLKIFPDKKTVLLAQAGERTYEFLVVALGSVTNYYDIPGLRQFSYPLKTISDALAIQCHLDSYFQTLWQKHLKKSVHIVVGGGGATGVEFACELPSYVEKLCGKYGYPRHDVHLLVVDGKTELIGVGPEVSQKVLGRLKKLGVSTRLGYYVSEAHAASICIKGPSGRIFEIPCDMLIWTGGIMPNPVLRESFPLLAKNGALEASETLETKYEGIFACGDSSFFTSMPVPPLAQVAIGEGKVVAQNIVSRILGKPLVPFRPAVPGIIIPTGGKYAIMKIDNHIFSGFWVWILRRFVDLSYAFSIMSLVRALQKWWHATNIFVKND